MAHIKSSWLFTFQHFPLSCMPSFSLLSCCVEPESAYINVIAAVYLSAQDTVNIIYTITTEAEKSGLCCVENCKKIFFYICCGCMFIASQSKLQKWKSSQNSTWTCFLFFLFAALMVCLKANTIYTGAAILLDETQASNSEVLQNPICILTLDPLFCCLHLCVPLLFLKTYISVNYCWYKSEGVSSWYLRNFAYFLYQYCKFLIPQNVGYHVLRMCVWGF